MSIFAHFVRLTTLAVALAACSETPATQIQPEAQDENFGVRAIDPWADETPEQQDQEAPQSTGRRVYVPEPSADQGERQDNNANGDRTEQTPEPNPADPGNEEGEPADPEEGNTNDDPAPEPEPEPEPQDPPATGIQGVYRFNDQQSLLYVQVFKDNSTLGARFAHNHAIRSTNWTGVLERVGAGTDCRVSLELPVEGLIVDEPQMRRRVGYDDDISDNQRAEIRGHMLADNQLNINAHPTMAFEGTRCSGADSDRGTVSIDGRLTIRGVTQAVRMTMQYRLIDGTLYLRGELGITHSDFGFRPYSAFAGSVRNQENMTLGFDFQSSQNN